MVCIPCFIIPILLIIWRKFVQPIMLRYWNPWEKKDAQGNVIKEAPQFPFECKDGVCLFNPRGKKQLENTKDAEVTAQTESDGAVAKENEANVPLISQVNKKDN